LVGGRDGGSKRIEIEPFRRLAARDRVALEALAERLARFVEPKEPTVYAAITLEEGRRMTSIEEHARAAVRLATRNVEAGQSPFAAIVVADGGAGEVIATGVNATHRDTDPTSHGEVERSARHAGDSARST
jgi:hypothetical protein